MRELRRAAVDPIIMPSSHAKKALLAFGVVCAVGLAPPRTACAMGIT
jgi:hypothetical protein